MGSSIFIVMKQNKKTSKKQSFNSQNSNKTIKLTRDFHDKIIKIKKEIKDLRAEFEDKKNAKLIQNIRGQVNSF